MSKITFDEINVYNKYSSDLYVGEGKILFKFNLCGMGGIVIYVKENVSSVYMLRALGLVGGCCVHNRIIQLCII